MALAFSALAAVPAGLDAVALGVLEGLVPLEPGRSLDADACRRLRFSGKLGEVAVVPGGSAPLEVLVGLGDGGLADADSLRRAGAAFARAVQGCARVGVALAALAPEGLGVAAAAQAVVEGIGLASYRFDRFKSAPEPAALGEVVCVSPDLGELESGLTRGRAVLEAVSLARDLANTPAAVLTPARFAELAAQAGAEAGLEVRVYGEEEIRTERLGGLAGVARGSAEPARLVRAVYEPPGAAAVPTVALVGKGITFDSGGLSLKTAAGMSAMKTDMSGAAAVLASLLACGPLGVAVRVVGYMALTENMPGGAATKPGDVLTVRNGKTIEVLNTDAEGRLVLADALSLAAEEAPDSIVDLATLTGACVVALGREIAGLMGNDDRLIDAIGAASRRAGEPTWPLPLPAGYRSHIDSEVADMKNIGRPGQAGAIAAALLLEEFVGSTPWAHLDIAGPSRAEDASGYSPKGATGFAVRTLLELLEHYETLGGATLGRSRGATVLR